MLNETINATGPIITAVSNFWEVVSVFIGGIFGLYIIIVIFRFLEYKKLNVIKKDLDTLKSILIKTNHPEKKKIKDLLKKKK